MGSMGSIMTFSALIKAPVRPSFCRVSMTADASSRELISWKLNLRLGRTLLCLLLLMAHSTASFVLPDSASASPQVHGQQPAEGLVKNGGVSVTQANNYGGADLRDGHIAAVEPVAGDAHLRRNAWGLESGASTIRSKFSVRGTHASPNRHDHHHGAASSPHTRPSTAGATSGSRNVMAPAPVVKSNSKPERPPSKIPKDPSNTVSLLRNLEGKRLRGPSDTTRRNHTSAGPPSVKTWTHDQLQQQQHNNKSSSRPPAPHPSDFSDETGTWPRGQAGGSSVCDARECVLIEQTSIGLNSMYSVEVLNVCACTVCHLHAYCPGFISTVAIDPKVFMRLPGSPDNCRVNDGYPIAPGGGIRFTYGGTFETEIRPSTSAPCVPSSRRPPPS